MLDRPRGSRFSRRSRESYAEETLFVDHTAEPGGAELAIGHYLRASTRDASLVVARTGPLVDDWRAAGIKVVAPSRAGRFGVVSELLFVRRHVRSRGNRLIVSNSMRAAFFVALTKPADASHVYYVRDGLGRESLSAPKRLVLRLLVQPGVSAYIVNSEWTGRTLSRKEQQKPRVVAYSPVGVLEASLPARNGEQEVLRVLSLSRLVPWKGIHVLLDAMARLVADGLGDRIRLTIAGTSTLGDGSYEKELHSRANDLGCEIRFPGFVSDIRPLLADNDVLVHASIKPEPFGQVVLQGMAAGMAVIATKEGGPAELVEHGVDGLLVEAGNAERLAGALIEIINEPELRRLLGERAQRKSVDYSDERLVERLDRAIASLVSSTAKRPGIDRYRPRRLPHE